METDEQTQRHVQRDISTDINTDKVMKMKTDIEREAASRKLSIINQAQSSANHQLQKANKNRLTGRYCSSSPKILYRERGGI